MDHSDRVVNMWITQMGSQPVDHSDGVVSLWITQMGSQSVDHSDGVVSLWITRKLVKLMIIQSREFIISSNCLWLTLN